MQFIKLSCIKDMLDIFNVLALVFCSTVHTVSALEHPLSAVLKDVLNSTITPVRGQLGPFRISGVSRSSAQNMLNWPFTNVSRIEFIV